MNLDAEKVLGRFAQAGAVRIHYGEAGAGPPVICLHGTGPGADAWANFRLNAGASRTGTARCSSTCLASAARRRSSSRARGSITCRARSARSWMRSG